MFSFEGEGTPKKLFLPSILDGGVPGDPVVELEGVQLLLQFWVDVLEVDLREWFLYYSTKNRLNINVFLFFPEIKLNSKYPDHFTALPKAFLDLNL